MSKENESEQIRAAVSALLLDRSWYVYDDGNTNWEESLVELSRKLVTAYGIHEASVEKLTSIFDQAYSPDSLFKINIGDESEPKEITFFAGLIDLARAENVELFIWTEGNLAWQQKKLDECSLTSPEGLPVEQILIYPKEKAAGVVDDLTELTQEFDDREIKEIYLHFIDDKKGKLDDIQTELGKENHDYHIRTHQVNGEGSATDIFLLLKDSIQINKDVQHLLFIDFDRTLVDAKHVMGEVVLPQIMALMS